MTRTDSDEAVQDEGGPATSRRSFLSGLGGSLLVGGYPGITAAAGATSGSAALAGCTSLLPEDDPEPVDVTEEELAVIAEIEVPDVDQSLPVGIGDEYVRSSRQRAESLLSAVPAEPAIPNEAVREYVTDERTEAREQLDRIDEQPTNDAKLDPLAGARSHAAEAEGAYAAAMGDRTRQDLYAQVEPLREERAELLDRFDCAGDVPHRALLVHGEIEGRLHRVSWGLDAVGEMSQVASEVEAVGAAADRLEGNRTNLEVASHLLE